MVRGVDYKGTHSTRESVEWWTVVGRYMTLCISQNPENCITQRVNFTGYTLKKKTKKQACQGTKDGIQTVTNESSCITNEWHSRLKEIWKERPDLTNFGKELGSVRIKIKRYIYKYCILFGKFVSHRSMG